MSNIEFTGSSGEVLAGILDEPEGEIKAYALFAHCFTCTKDFPAAARIARALARLGIAVFRFDFTGLGASAGVFANTNFTTNVLDLLHAADYMRENLGAPSILVGHSLGGAAVLVASSFIPETKASVTIGAPADIDHVLLHMSEKEDEILAKGEANVNLGGRLMKVKKQFFDDARSQNLEACIKKLNNALLVMHSPIDQTVGIENAGKIFGAAKHPKSFVSLDNSDHLLSKRENATYCADVISAWVNRYI